MDTQEVEFSRKLEKEKSLLSIMMLVPHKRYLVSIKVQSAGVTSEVVEDSTITMIDRECPRRCALSAVLFVIAVHLHTIHFHISVSCHLEDLKGRGNGSISLCKVPCSKQAKRSEGP